MAAYDAFLVCAPRDTLDVLGIIGPTVAAAGAVVATIYAARVARQVGDAGVAATNAAAELERKINRPFLNVWHQITGQGDRTLWQINMANKGQSIAIVRRFGVYVDDQLRPIGLDQNPTTWWTELLTGLGLATNRVVGHFHHAPFTLDVGEPSLIVAAEIGRPEIEVIGAKQHLSFRVGYEATWGDQYSIPPAPQA